MKGRVFVVLVFAALLFPRAWGATDYRYEDLTFDGAKGATLVGRIFIPKEQNDMGIVIYHGFGGSCEGFYSEQLPVAQTLAGMGYTVLTYDHRAHDHSTGDFDFECLVEDAMTAIDVLQSYGVGRMGVVGHSMGGMIAVLVSAYDPRVECTVAWAAPKSINSAIAWILGSALRDEPTEEDFLMAINEVYGTGLSLDRVLVPIEVGKLHTTVSDLLHFFSQSQLPRYRPIAHAKDTDTIRFVHGTADTTVNPEDSADMYEVAGYPKDLLYIEGASHNSGDHEEEFLDAIVSWFDAEFY